MEFEGSQLNINELGSSGIVLSVEQEASLQASLVILARDHKFRKVKLWGVVKGVQKDYFVAQGVGRDELKDRKFVYSQDLLQWNLLPHVDDGLKHKSTLLQGRFTGDPSFVFELTATQRTGEGENTIDKVTTIEMKEEDRLAAVVTRIDEEGAIVPRGAYIKTALNEVTINRSFQGLSFAEAKNLHYYVHFKETQTGEEEEKDIRHAMDFLKSLETDIPKGCWSLQMNQGGASVVLRSLIWLGMVLYHNPGTPKFGYFYCGTGEKNLDIPFMF
ncbi:hypothetical protein EMCRGX_G033119 [Ephydatia muelleri]|eukprot:Em0019g846a